MSILFIVDIRYCYCWFILILYFRGLDNKVTVYPLSLDEDVSLKKKTVGTHTSYMSCCIFPNSDQQVIFPQGMNKLMKFNIKIILINKKNLLKNKMKLNK